nr:hypothetical protein [Nocardia bovistercoris]
MLKEIHAYAAGIDAEVEIIEGGNHTKVVVGGRRTVIARHNELNELTVKSIRKQLGMDGE